jgi:hypothetical protein
VLTRNNTISAKLRKEPREECKNLSHTAIFKVLHKREYERILLHYYGYLPATSQVFYYDECLKMFSQIPIMEVYILALSQLKGRNTIMISEFEEVPYELKSLVYFSKISDNDWAAVNSFLNNRFGG